MQEIIYTMELTVLERLLSHLSQYASMRNNSYLPLTQPSLLIDTLHDLANSSYFIFIRLFKVCRIDMIQNSL